MRKYVAGRLASVSYRPLATVLKIADAADRRLSTGDTFDGSPDADLEERLMWAEAHPAAAANISANARAHVLRVLGASVASERRVVMAVLRGYRQALACAQPA